MTISMETLVQQFPWFVGLVGVVTVFLGMRTIIIRLIGALDLALERAQTVPPPVGLHPAPVPQPAPSPAPTPAPAKPSGPFAEAPPWFQWALHEVGFHETGANQGIGRYIQLSHCGSPGDPWCAIFANAALEAAGVPGTRSPSSQSFRSHPNFVQLAAPALGAIAVYWRGTRESGLGHVGFYRGEDASRVWTLGGNENDMVEIAALPKAGNSFGLIGYWWPKGVPLPTGGPVMMPAGSPTSIQADPTPGKSSAGGKQTSIVATVFYGETSAYSGGPVDDSSPGVALPNRFSGSRPRVRVSNPKTGASVDCDIVDVGPWNIDDPYWETGSRPQAESGTDKSGRHTNRAGIDLTLAAAKAVAIDGKGLVDWAFIEQPNVTVT